MSSTGKRRRRAPAAPSAAPSAFDVLGGRVAYADGAQRAKQASARFALRALWGFEEYRATQEQVVHAALRGHDCLVVMPTGGGKSLCFQIPAVVDAGVTIVVSPLISLMEDQINHLVSLPRGNGIPAMCWCSNATASAKQAMGQELSQKVHPALKLLYTTPEVSVCVFVCVLFVAVWLVGWLGIGCC
jgi:superfamily II DNA helicase RecQ